jgi:hypothetical protein
MVRLTPLLRLRNPRPARGFVQRTRRLWSGLSWGVRMITFGAVIVVIMVAARLVAGIWRGLIDAAGLGAFYGTLLLTGLPRIRNWKDPAARVAARSAAVIAGTGAALGTVGVFLNYFSVAGWAGVEVAGAALLLASVVAFAVVDQVAWAVRLFGRAAVVIGSVLLVAAIFLFSPIIVFLMTNGQWPSPLLGGPQEPSLVDLMSVVPPVSLVFGPMVLRKVLAWDDAKEQTQRLAPAWLAGFALTFTFGYALALHFFAGNPLAATSLAGFALAILFVGAILWPFYKLIAASFWRHGITDAVKLTSWWSDQQTMGKDLYDAIRQVWRNAREGQKDQASGPGPARAVIERCPNRPDDGHQPSSKPEDGS